ncbi:hypothetical protein LEMLEM_LOCUS24671 [Lemmus lemmus]
MGAGWPRGDRKKQFTPLITAPVKQKPAWDIQEVSSQPELLHGEAKQTRSVHGVLECSSIEQPCRVGEALGPICSLAQSGREKDYGCMSLCVCVCVCHGVSFYPCVRLCAPVLHMFV